jgi:hypothetical protein
MLKVEAAIRPRNHLHMSRYEDCGTISYQSSFGRKEEEESVSVQYNS